MIGPTITGAIASSRIVASAPSWTNAYSVDFGGTNEAAWNTNSGLETMTKSGGRTLSFWLKMATLDNYALVSCVGDLTASNPGFWTFRTALVSGNYRIRIQRRVQGIPTTPAIDGTTNLATNTWYMITITTNGSGNIMYVNTTSQGARSNAINGDWWGNCGMTGAQIGVIFGSQTFTFGLPLTGKMDEVTLWNKELSSTEVGELYNSGSAFNPTSHSASANLTSYWRLGDGDTHPTLTDSVGGYNMSMQNMESGDIQTDVP